MLDAYDVLMNDEELLEQGQMGIERLRSDPSDLHRKQGGARQFARRASQNSSRQQIREIRDTARRQLIDLGDGLIRADSGKIVFWFGTNAAPDPAHNLRAQKEIDQAAQDAAVEIRKNPDLEFRRKLTDGTFEAKAIRFGSAKCLSCHAGAKQNGVAAVAAVVYRKGIQKPRDIGAKPEQSTISANSIEKLFGLPVYPSSSAPGNVQIYSFPKQKSAYVNYRTKDSTDQVFSFYRRALSKVGNATIVEGSGWLKYEFGDASFGQIRVGDHQGESSLNLTFHRLIK